MNSTRDYSPQSTKKASQRTKPREIDRLKKAMDWCLNSSSFDSVKSHANAKWNAKSLIVLAVLTAWGTEPRMTDSFAEASKLSSKLYGVIALKTYQGMMRALVTYTGQLLPIVWMRLRTQIEKASPDTFRIGRWLPLAVDGSRFTTPRTKSNEKAFAAKNYGTGKRAKSRDKWKNKAKQEVQRTSEATNLVDAGLAYGQQASVVLEIGSFQLQRAKPSARDDSIHSFPAKHAILWRCGIHRLRILVGYYRVGQRLSCPSRRQCQAAQKSWSLPQR